MNSEEKAVHGFWMIILLNLMSQNIAGTVILLGACSVIDLPSVAYPTHDGLTKWGSHGPLS